jgi:hypothetical protein
MDHPGKSNPASGQTLRLKLWRFLLSASVCLAHIDYKYLARYARENKIRSVPARKPAASVLDATRLQTWLCLRTFPSVPPTTPWKTASIHTNPLDRPSRRVNYIIMRETKILRTCSEVVAEFGGTKEAAEWAGVGESAVSNWLARGFIPPGWHFRMSVHFADQGVLLAGTVFGERDDRPSARPEISTAA